MPFTLCTSGAIVIKGGANVSSTASTSAAILEQFSLQAEGFLNSATRRDWNAIFDTLNSSIQSTVSEVVSNIGGAYLIEYDMSGYTSRSEAIAMVDILRDRALQGVSVLRDIKTQTFIDGA